MWPRLIDCNSLLGSFSILNTLYFENSDLPREELLYWIYFLLSCPAEIKGFDPIRTLSMKIPVAATLLFIAGNFTKAVPFVGKTTDSTSKDIEICWNM